MGRRFNPTESLAFYWSTFTEFCRHEVTAGGPDPHMRVIERLTEGLSDEERIWRIGCYLSVFNVPTAELIWQRWPRERVLAEPRSLELWLREHWKGLHLRRERRPVKAPHRLREHLVSFAGWSDGRFLALREARTYEDAWEVLNEIRYVGRYAAIKLGEVIHRCFPEVPAMDDMRPRGGKHPRVGLAYLYPKHVEELNGSDTPSNMVLTNLLGRDVQQRLLAEEGLDLDCFHMEALLCDYKQSYHGRQYPGRSQDSELDHYRKVKAYWGDRFETMMFTARRQLFPEWALGEVQSWDGIREPLKTVLKEHGYTWSDELYDYARTKDFAHPVRRST